MIGAPGQSQRSQVPETTTAVRVTQLNKVDPKASSKVSVAVEPFTGKTAEGYEFTDACYLQT